jgi:hypothetical protein
MTLALLGLIASLFITLSDPAAELTLIECVPTNVPSMVKPKPELKSSGGLSEEELVLARKVESEIF